MTDGKQWYDVSYNNTGNIFSFNYIFHNKFTIGISRRYFSIVRIYEGTGDSDSSGFLNTEVGSQRVSSNTAYNSYYFFNTYYNIYTQINLFELLHKRTPISLSLLTAIQRNSNSTNFAAVLHLYKKIQLNDQNSIQPSFSIGYRDLSYFNYAKNASFSSTLIILHMIYTNTDLLVMSKMNFFSDYKDFSIQIGISHGLGK